MYAECLAYELQDRTFYVEAGLKIPITYRGRLLSSHYLLDLRVNRLVIVEIKSVAALAPVHTAQLTTYLKLANCAVGLLINFNVPLLKEGIKRVVRRGAGEGINSEAQRNGANRGGAGGQQ